MQIERRVSQGASARLSFGELVTAELFLLWAIRERLASGAGSPHLVGAFRRVFGLAAVEDVLAAFERSYTVLTVHLTRTARLLSPTSVAITRDELLLLHAFAALQKGRGAHGQAIAQTLVGPVWACALCQSMRELGSFMTERRLNLRLRGLATLAWSRATRH